MGKQAKTAIMPTRAEDYPEWYQQVIKASNMADRSPVRGCMVIKPWGYSLWENIMRKLDDMFKATGVKNAYFPLFIPLSFLEKKQVIDLAAQFDLQPTVNPCPLDGETKRDTVRQLLEPLYQKDSHIKGNIFSALANVRTDYMLKKDVAD